MLIKKVSVEDERRRSTALLDSVAAVSKQESQANNRATKKWQLLPELDTESACSFSSPPNESDWEDDFEQDDSSSCTKIKSQDSLQGKRYYYFEDVPSSSVRRAADSHPDDDIPQSYPRTSSSSWMKIGAFVVIGAVGLYAAFTLGERMGEKKAAQASFWRVRDVETLLFAW